ncbi:hypothetical protein D3C84_1277120 [compost metagenome]
MLIIIRSILIALVLSIFANFMSTSIEKLFTIRQDDTPVRSLAPNESGSAGAADETAGMMRRRGV